MSYLDTIRINLEYSFSKLGVDDGDREGEDDEDEGGDEPQPRLDKLHRPQLCERLQNISILQIYTYIT